MPGSYFITICAEDRQHLFGRIQESTMIYSDYGQLVVDEILRLPTYHERCRLDEWVVMPNHIHLLITLEIELPDTNEPAPPPEHSTYWWHYPNHTPDKADLEQYRKHRRKMLIPKMMGKLKMLTSKGINDLRGTPEAKNWQRGYHDHVIRTLQSYDNIQRYIRNNVSNWDGDTFR
jgi:REP element-mobilizing transposase RayT